MKLELEGFPERSCSLWVANGIGPYHEQMDNPQV